MKLNEKLKKSIVINSFFVLIGLYSTKIAQAYRITQGTNIIEKMKNIGDGFLIAFENLLPSFNMQDLIFGLFVAVVIKVLFYINGLNKKKFRKGVEYGSARFGTSNDIKPYVDTVFKNNVILTQTEHLTMNNRPKNPKTARNKNVLIIGGSGSGKTRFWLKPNLMQCHSSYVVTDPNGYNT